MKELGIPGLSTPDPITWGIPRITSLVGVSGFGNDSSGPFAIYDAVFQWTDNSAGSRASTRCVSAAKSAATATTRKATSSPGVRSNSTGQYTSNPSTRKGGDSTRRPAAGQHDRGGSGHVARLLAVPRHQRLLLFRRHLPPEPEADGELRPAVRIESAMVGPIAERGQRPFAVHRQSGQRPGQEHTPECWYGPERAIFTKARVSVIPAFRWRATAGWATD